MHIELTPSASRQIDALIAPEQGLDAWGFLESGLVSFEEKREIVPPTQTIEEIRREVTIGLEQLARGEIVEGTAEEAIRRSLEEAIARHRARRSGTPSVDR